MRLFTIFMTALILSYPCRADMDKGWQAYADGDYSRARQLFLEDPSAPGLAAACQAGLVKGGFFEDAATAVKTLHEALDHCKAALLLDPSHIDARISYAIGLGFEGKRLKKASYAKASKAMLEETTILQPDYPILLAALGGWHSEVYNAGFFARLALGPKRETAADHFARALALAPESIRVRFEFIKFLAHGKKSDWARAREELGILESLKPRDAFARFLKGRALVIRAALENKDKKALEEALDRATAFSQIVDSDEPAPYPIEDEDD